MSTKILVVSGNAILGKKIENEFCGSPFRVEITEKSALALELLKNNDYHSVILDTDTNGGCIFELLHKIKVLRYPAGVVLITAAVKADDMLLAYDLGVADIIIDKFESGTLAASVSRTYDSINQGD